MKILVVVDMQNDFIDGALGTKEAEAIVPGVAEMIRTFDGTVIATRDTHGPDYMESQEGRNLPVLHCVKGTDGWEIREEIRRALSERGAAVIDKPTFGSVELGNYIKELDNAEDPVKEITLIGLCTDICVISNAMILKAVFPEVPIQVYASCCAGVTVESHARALEAMKVCQIKVTEE